MSAEAILFVDDEPNVLDGMRDHFRRKFTVQTATSGAEGLRIISESKDPFTVVVSDMRMPEMNGATFLAAVRAKSPDTIRILLTGNSGMDEAILAVNEGNLFRFLTKPCPAEVLAAAIDAGVRQFHLLRVEQELLEKTVKGCVQVLTDMLGLANPYAISRTTRIKHYSTQIASALGLGQLWQLEIAALLSQIGCIAIPHEVMKKTENYSFPLSPEELAMFQVHPQIARDLIATIPRLQFVAEIVAHQNTSFKLAKEDKSINEAVLMGASILKAAVDLDTFQIKAGSLESAITIMERKTASTGEYNPSIIRILPRITSMEHKQERRTVRIADLSIGMLLAQEVKTTSGVLLLSRGQRINALTKMHLQNHTAKGMIRDEVVVFANC